MSFDPIPVPAVVYQQPEVRAAHADPVDAMLAEMHRAYTLELCTEREALVRGLEVLRESIAPVVRGPRRSGSRVSAKARRRAVAALDRLIADAKQTGVRF